MSIQSISQSTPQATGASIASASSSASTTTASSSSAASTTAPTSSYSVNISNAARALLAEASETSVKASQEAGKGDQQAQRLLAREAAAKAA